jgi:hypothetical protein
LSVDLSAIAAARLIVAVGAYRTLHGFGPTWAEACRAVGWHDLDYAERGDRLWALRRAGLITFTRKTRSLDVTPAGARWALATIRRDGDERGRP